MRRGWGAGFALVALLCLSAGAAPAEAMRAVMNRLRIDPERTAARRRRRLRVAAVMRAGTACGPAGGIEPRGTAPEPPR